MDISVIGLGKLGLCTAACFASRGHNVTGLDKNPDFTASLREKKNPINETDLDALLEKAWPNLCVAKDMEEAVLNSEITLIIVPTPSKNDGRFTNQYVKAVLEEIGPILAKKEKFHIVDVVSTVMPGSCESEFIPLLERLSGKSCGKDFGLVYNPEFIALGSVVRDFLNPDMVLIGASDEYSGKKTGTMYSSTCLSDPKIQVMSLVNAEITKLSLNCFVTMKISYANELAGICQKIDGANVDTITKALGADTRIGGKYLKGGLGFGGPCFPRDNIAFQEFAKEFGSTAKLGTQVVEINNAVVQRLFELLTQGLAKGASVALLGLAYKAGTHIIEQSQSIMLGQKLITEGYKLKVYDLKALDTAKAQLGQNVEYCSDPYECASNTQAIALLTDSPEISELDFKKLVDSADKNPILVDSWRITPDGLAARVKKIGCGTKK